MTKATKIDLDINIFPNPVKGGMVRIDLHTSLQNDLARLSIINKNGQRVHLQELLLKEGKTTTIDLSKCPSGSYHAVVNLRDEVVSEQFIVLNG